MAGDTAKAVAEVTEAVNIMREKVEKYGLDSVEAKEIIEKIETKMIADEEAHQKAILEIKEVEKKALATEERLEDLELELAKKSIETGVNYKEQDEYKALQSWFKKGDKEVTPEELGILRESKTLRMDDSTAGGYLTTTEMDSLLLKTITEISPVRGVSRVKSVSKKTLEIAKRTAIPTAYYEGEAEQNQLGQSVYGSEQLTTYRLSVTVPFTMDLLMDSQFDLETEINADVAESFAYKEGNKFVLGTGSKQPEGFLVNAALVADPYTSAASGVISADDMLLITGQLKVGYNPMYGFNRGTLAYLRTLKAAVTGHYIWQQGLAPNAPNSIAGEPYVVMQDMPAIAASSLSIIYGDFLRGYTITDRTGMMIIRDDVTSARNAIVNMTFHRWNTGQVVLSEAFKILKTKA